MKKILIPINIKKNFIIKGNKRKVLKKKIYSIYLKIFLILSLLILLIIRQISSNNEKNKMKKYSGITVINKTKDNSTSEIINNDINIDNYSRNIKSNSFEILQNDNRIENYTENKENHIFEMLHNDSKIDDQRENFTNYIHLALNIDYKYLYPCIVFLTSLLYNQDKTTFYIIHILHGENIRKDAYDRINSTILKLGKNSSNVTFYNMGGQFRGATSGRYISTAAYYRISLPSLLPNVDRIIYTDSDVINFKDLSEMYNINFNNKTYFSGILDYIGNLDELRRLRVYTDKYMNTGVLLINLKEMRIDDIEKKIRDFVSTHFLNHHEQTAINAVCYNNIQILSYKYACFAFDSYYELLKFNNQQNVMYKYNEKELTQSFNEPTLLHFPGYVKPWHKNCRNRKRVYWWYYAKKSIYYQEILEHYQYNIEEIEDLLKLIPNDDTLIKQKI